MLETPSWLLPVAGSLFTLVAIVAFLRGLPNRAAAVAAVMLIIVVGVWNAVAVSAWSLGSAILIIIWVMYTLQRVEFRERGISSGKPLPKAAKWIFVFIVVEAVVGIAHSYYTYVH